MSFVETITEGLKNVAEAYKKAAEAKYAPENNPLGTVALHLHNANAYLTQTINKAVKDIPQPAPQEKFKYFVGKWNDDSKQYEIDYEFHYYNTEKDCYTFIKDFIGTEGVYKVIKSIDIGITKTIDEDDF